MGFSTVTLQCNASGTALSAFTEAPAGNLVAASVFHDTENHPLESTYASLHIGIQNDTNETRQICLARGYVSSLQPLTWTGKIQLQGNETLVVFGRSTATAKLRAVFMTEREP
jgi:hypothetical protein